MRRPWWAIALLAAGSAAILVLWFGFGASASGHHHNEASAVLVGASQSSSSTPAAAGSGGPAPAAADGPADGTGEGAAGGPTTGEPASASAAPTPNAGSDGQDDPNASAAARRQIGLVEAAGQAPAGSTSTAAPSLANQWVDADAAGVNEGTKRQAAGVTLQPAPVVDPSQVLPSNGLTNGCVAGYGRGTQCLPQTPPSHAGHGVGDMSIYWTCAEARSLLPDGIVVDTAGTDPLGLDSNGDGTACGAGDR